MALTPCAPCDCIPANISNEVFKQDVIILLCAILDVRSDLLVTLREKLTLAKEIKAEEKG